jgi:hypothetical protein
MDTKKKQPSKEKVMTWLQNACNAMRSQLDVTYK